MGSVFPWQNEKISNNPQIRASWWLHWSAVLKLWAAGHHFSSIEYYGWELFCHLENHWNTHQNSDDLSQKIYYIAWNKKGSKKNNKKSCLWISTTGEIFWQICSSQNDLYTIYFITILHMYTKQTINATQECSFFYSEFLFKLNKHHKKLNNESWRAHVDDLFALHLWGCVYVNFLAHFACCLLIFLFCFLHPTYKKLFVFIINCLLFLNCFSLS